MELVEIPSKVDSTMELKGLEGEEILTSGVSLERELECCGNKCNEVESRCRKAEDRCAVLVQEIERRKREFELLDDRFTVLAIKKNEIEDEVKVLKQRNAGLEKLITRVENENNDITGQKGTEEVIGMRDKDVEDKIIQLTIENKVLECEKKRAESDVEVWRRKCGELESQLLVLEKENLVLTRGQSPLTVNMGSQQEVCIKQTNKAGNMKDGSDVGNGSEHLETENGRAIINEIMHAETLANSTYCSPLKGIGNPQAAETPSTEITRRQTEQVDSRKRVFIDTEMDHKRVRKKLTFGEEGNLGKKLAPSTPRPPPPFGVIHISDSEDDLTDNEVHKPIFESQVNKAACVSTEFSPGDDVDHVGKKSFDDHTRTLLGDSDEEDMNSYKQNCPFTPTPRRKRASNIVTTDSESEDDDNVPIGKLQTRNLWGLLDHDVTASCLTATVSEKVSESATPRRRLVALRNCNVKNAPSPSNSYDWNSNYHEKIPDNDEMKEDGSESDAEDESLGGFIIKSSDISDDDDSCGYSASECTSDENVDFNEVLSRIRRNNDNKIKWEFEGEMLAAFGKDIELCMRAVCALYRQQTSDEKFSKGTLYANQRGFSQCDAFRGTTLAEFLTDGDPKGDLVKSAKELQDFDWKGPELCQTLAKRYSKQLFTIYKNKEDPLFLPS